MRSINEIRLHNLLPHAFDGMQGESFIKSSQVWLADLTLQVGQSYTIAAESGAGKSSLCSFIYGNRSDYSGTISFDGKNARELSISQWCELRRESFALLPQEMRLFPELTAMENVMLKNRLTDFRSEKEILEMMEHLDIAFKANSLAGKMSVGQQQRVAIIRTLCQPFSFLFLDEPVSHLDGRNNSIVAKLIEEEAHAQGAAIVSTSVGNPLALSQSTLIKL